MAPFEGEEVAEVPLTPPNSNPHDLLSHVLPIVPSPMMVDVPCTILNEPNASISDCMNVSADSHCVMSDNETHKARAPSTQVVPLLHLQRRGIYKPTSTVTSSYPCSLNAKRVGWNSQAQLLLQRGPDWFEGTLPLSRNTVRCHPSRFLNSGSPLAIKYWQQMSLDDSVDGPPDPNPFYPVRESPTPKQKRIIQHRGAMLTPVKPIGRIGCVVGPPLPSPPTPSFIPRPPLCHPTVIRVLDDLQRQGALKQLPEPDSSPLHGSMFTLPKNASKSLLILDLRPTNALAAPMPMPMDCPPAHPLQVLKHLNSQTPFPCFFTKLDVSNCYWSILGAQQFKFQVRTDFGTSFWSTNRYPFGHQATPALCQQLMHTLVSQTLQVFGHSSIQYELIYDDILLWDPDPIELQLATLRIMEAMSIKGFLLNEKKCISDPCTTILFIGKRFLFSQERAMWQMMDPGTAIHLANDLLNLSDFVPIHWALIRSWMGLFQWLCPLGALSYAYHVLLDHSVKWFARGRRPHFTPALRQALLRILGRVHQPVVLNLGWMQPTDVPTMIVITDATVQQLGLVFLLPNVGLLALSQSVPPKKQHSQQQSELLAIWAGLSRAIQVLTYSNLPFGRILVLSDNMAAICAITRGTGRILPICRRAIVQRIWNKCQQTNMHFSFGFIPSIGNIADYPSRNWLDQLYLPQVIWHHQAPASPEPNCPRMIYSSTWVPGSNSWCWPPQPAGCIELSGDSLGPTWL